MPKIICSGCGKTKRHHAKGLCRNCYQRQYQKTDKHKQYQKEYRKTEKHKQYRRQYQKTDKYKQHRKQYRKQYNKRLIEDAKAYRKIKESEKEKVE